MISLTPAEQVAMHEHVEDARRVLLNRKTGEAFALDALLSQMRGAINDRIRNEQPLGLMNLHLRRACAEIIKAG